MVEEEQALEARLKVLQGFVADGYHLRAFKGISLALLLLQVTILPIESIPIVVEPAGQLEAGLFQGLLEVRFLLASRMQMVVNHFIGKMDRLLKVGILLCVVLLLCMNACNVVVANG